MFSGPEKEILTGLTELIRKEDPDIITGYNIDNFDIGRVVDRALQISKKTRKSNHRPWVGVVFLNQNKIEQEILFTLHRGQTRAWNMAGRCVMDAWWQARQALRPQREPFLCFKSIIPRQRRNAENGCRCIKYG